MSCRIDATGDRLERTATVPAFGDFTLCYWAYRVVDGGDNETMIALTNSGSGSGQGQYVNGAGGDKVNVISTGPTFNATASPPVFTTGTWQRVAMTFDNAGNSINLYTGDDVPSDTMSNSDIISDAGSFVVDRIGAPFHQIMGGTFFNGRFANIKLYTRVLTVTEIETELQYFNVQNSTGIWGAWTCKTETSTITDQSGNSRPLTGTGLTSEADPPITDAPGPGVAIPAFQLHTAYAPSIQQRMM